MTARAAKVGALTAVLAASGFAYFAVEKSRAPKHESLRPHAKEQVAAAAALDSLVDPVVPHRPATLASASRSLAADWVTARPSFQYSHTSAERGGVEPCASQKVDLSEYENWTSLGTGLYVIPRSLALDDTGNFDLVIHLHGNEPVRRELVLSKQHFVLFTLTLDPTHSYAPLFSGSHLYEAIVAGIEQAVSTRAHTTAHARHIALSAWSAGFVGIEALLAQPASRDVDAVVLVDGLHAPRGNASAFKAQLKPFVDYAARAANGERFMFISHSSIDPSDFASTTECAHYLVSSLGGRPTPVKRDDALGLELVEFFSRGELNVRGYAGNDKPDHCAQLGVLRDVFAALGRRWEASARGELQAKQ